MNKYHDIMLKKMKPKSSLLTEPRQVTQCLDEYKPIFRNPQRVRKEENSISKFLSNLIPRRESTKPPKKPPRKEKQSRNQETDRELLSAGDEIYQDILHTVQLHTTPTAPPRKGIIKGTKITRSSLKLQNQYYNIKDVCPLLHRLSMRTYHPIQLKISLLRALKDTFLGKVLYLSSLSTQSQSPESQTENRLSQLKLRLVLIGVE